MMLGSGSQSCVRRGDKDDQRCQQSSGEAYRISFENISHRLCGDFHLFVSAFHLSFDIAFLNGRVELSHMLQLLACHSYSILLCSSSFLGWHEEIFQPLLHADAVFQCDRNKRCANELLLAMFRAEDIRVLRRGPLRVLTNPTTKAPSWCRDAGFSTSERYAELDHHGPCGLSRHTPS